VLRRSKVDGQSRLGGGVKLTTVTCSTSGPRAVVFVPFVLWHKPACLLLRNDVDLAMTTKDSSWLSPTQERR
jgi:hypothetical protein